MSTFRKYDHLERTGHQEVRDIEFGTVHVFPKLDGTNASVWLDFVGDEPAPDVVVRAGSRNRTLTTDNDNAGFCAWVQSDDPRAAALRDWLMKNPALIVYGEWLVPHTLKTYRDDAWRRFYVFDVFDRISGGYLSFEQYAPQLVAAGVDVLHPLAIIENPSDNQLAKLRDTNTVLIADGAGAGEGIVLKNYNWRNQFGRQPWAKMVRNEFKESNRALFGIPVTAGEKQTEADIIAAHATPEFIRKEWAKVINAHAAERNVALFPDDYSGTLVLAELGPTYASFSGANTLRGFVEGHRGALIPRFLGTLFHTFVAEECWAFVKKFRNPVVDFSKLNKLLTIAAKRVLTDVF